MIMYKELLEIYLFLSQFKEYQTLTASNLFNLTYQLYEEKNRFNRQINYRFESQAN